MPFATQEKKTFATWICLMLFTEGAHFVVIPTILRQIYGTSASSIYGVLFTFTGLSNLAMIFIVGSQFGKNYDKVFQLSAILNVIALTMLIIGFK